MTPAPIRVPTRKIVTFRLGSDYFGFEVEQVERVIRPKSATPLPDVPEWIRGVIDYGSKVVPLVDMRRRVSLPAERARFQSRIMIARTSEGLLGALVDAVLEVATIPETDLEPPPPVVRGIAAEFIRAIVRPSGAREHIIVILDADRMLTSTDRIALEQALERTELQPEGAARG